MGGAAARRPLLQRPRTDWGWASYSLAAGKAQVVTHLYRLAKIEASSDEFVGEWWRGQVAEGVIDGDLQGFGCTKSYNFV